MKPLLLALLLTGLLPAQGPDIDWTRARDLFRREQRGETLEPADRAYLDRAKAARRGGSANAGGSASQRKAPARLIPLCDMGAGARYEGEDGGLYGGGRHAPAEPLQRAAEAALTQIRPLDAEGRPSAEGRVVLVSISMSNATQEFSVFKRLADADPRKSPRLTIVDCAQGGQAMAEWAPPEGRPWQEALARLARAGVSPAQVQVAWVKLANKGPSGSMTDHLAKLETDTTAVLRNARARFPNLRVVYLGSRIWAGNATGNLNPEPYAYETAFAARHLILQQPAAKGAVADAGPILLWGPYLWAEGEKGRQLDDLRYLPADFAADGVHPSTSGREKVARQLLDFFTSHPLAKSWFCR
jgi:hypothetical protein